MLQSVRTNYLTTFCNNQKSSEVKIATNLQRIYPYTNKTIFVRNTLLAAETLLTGVHKIVHGLSTVNLRPFFQYHTQNRKPEHPLKLTKNSVRKDLPWQHFFSERVIRNWNGLENETVCAPSVSSFKITKKGL